MKALGITDGIGSLLYGPDQEGFKILGNYEWRKYYNTGTFEKNFRAPYITAYDELIPKWKGLDLITSHPECGNFSNLYTGKNKATRQGDPGDIFKFTELCSYYEPKHFICDNLPNSLLAVTANDWRGIFPNYKLDFVYVSNWGYGNTQRHRKRLFVIGTHRDIKWQFVPQEEKHGRVLEDIVNAIPLNAHNHHKMQLTDPVQWRGYQIGQPKLNRLTLKQLQPWLKSAAVANNMPYYNKQGEIKSKPGYSILNFEKPAPTLSGGGGFYDNHWILDPFDNYYRPLTMRERLSIQGFGLEFILEPGDFEWGTQAHQWAIKQTGKCMPVEFAREVARQILKGNRKLVATRVDKVPQIITEANYVRNID